MLVSDSDNRPWCCSPLSLLSSPLPHRLPPIFINTQSLMTLTTYPFSCWLGHCFPTPRSGPCTSAPWPEQISPFFFRAVGDGISDSPSLPIHPSHTLFLPFSLPFLPSPSLPSTQAVWAHLFWCQSCAWGGSFCDRYRDTIQLAEKTQLVQIAGRSTTWRYLVFRSDIWLIWALSPVERIKD